MCRLKRRQRHHGGYIVSRAPQNFAAGCFLIFLAALALWQGRDLNTGTLAQFGSGMLPRGLAVICAGLGLLILVDSLRTAGAGLERWSIRGGIFVLGAAVAFGLTVRPLGLAVAGPVAICLSALASNESKFTETIIFGLLLTGFCLGLFRFALHLPIPVAPWLIGY